MKKNGVAEILGNARLTRPGEVEVALLDGGTRTLRPIISCWQPVPK